MSRWSPLVAVCLLVGCTEYTIGTKLQPRPGDVPSEWLDTESTAQQDSESEPEDPASDPLPTSSETSDPVTGTDTDLDTVPGPVDSDADSEGSDGFLGASDSEPADTDTDGAWLGPTDSEPATTDSDGPLRDSEPEASDSDDGYGQTDPPSTDSDVVSDSWTSDVSNSDPESDAPGDSDTDTAPTDTGLTGEEICERAARVFGYLDRFQTPGDGRVFFCHFTGSGWHYLETDISACLSHAQQHSDTFPTTGCDS